MSQKETFVETVQNALKKYNENNDLDIVNSLNYCFTETDAFDFDIDSAFIECAKKNNVNYVIIDLATATLDDIETIHANWNQPTAYLFKNYGDESSGNVRTKITIFVKDRYLGITTSDDSEPQVAFCGVTVTAENPIRDFYERQVFFMNISL